MKKLKVTLVVPNFRWANWDVNTLWHYFPYSLCLLAAMIEDTCEVSILDAYKPDMSQEEFKSRLSDLNPDVIGITVLMDQYGPSGHEAAAMAKSINKNMTVIMGGVYSTINPDRVAADPNVDFAIVGEGEYVLREILGYLRNENPLPKKGIAFSKNGNGSIENRGAADLVQDLDALPLPAYHLVDFDAYSNSAIRKSVDAPRAYPYARLLSSRGCPYGCTFCQVGSITGTRMRYRSPENVVKEIKFLKEKYGIKSIIFDDDNLFTKKENSKALFQALIDHKINLPWVAIAVAVFRLDEEIIKLMKQSGCEYVDIAIESGNERVIRKVVNKPVVFDRAVEMIKILKREGIYVAANFIIGYPTETWFEIRETIKFAETVEVDYVKIFTYMPLKNTKLWKMTEEKNVWKKGYDFDKTRWGVGQIETEHFRANDLTILRAYEWDRINFSNPQKLERTARQMNITVEELNAIRRRTLDDACKNAGG